MELELLVQQHSARWSNLLPSLQSLISAEFECEKMKAEPATASRAEDTTGRTVHAESAQCCCLRGTGCSEARTQSKDNPCEHARFQQRRH
eukprot:10021-Heterococcus_DN1.PRE.2